jgi:hypothetical protein
VDIGAVADAALAILRAPAKMGDDLLALEINPLFVRGSLVEVLDALPSGGNAKGSITN